MMLDPQQLIRRHLTDSFILLSKKNPRISLRAYAKRLGISNSALSEMMRGKRKISRDKAIQLATTLKIPSKDLEILKRAYDPKNRLESLKGTDNPLTEILLDSSNFHLIGDWRYFAVMSVVRGSRGLLRPSVVAEMLDLTENEVTAILDEYLRMGLAKRKAGGEIELPRVVFRTPLDTTSEMLRQRKLDSLSGAERAIKEDLPGGVFFATIGTDKSKLDAATDLIEDFIKRLAIFLRDPNSTDVFELAVHLFPRTRPLNTKQVP